MTRTAPTIELGLPLKLQDREYRRRFFLAEASARIAGQLVALRKRRQLNQNQVAQLVGTGQPAISRAERADYQSWSFKTLRSIADALDARIRVIIEPAEDVIHEYGRESKLNDRDIEDLEPQGAAAKAAAAAATRLLEFPESYLYFQEGKKRVFTIDGGFQ